MKEIMSRTKSEKAVLCKTVQNSVQSGNIIGENTQRIILRFVQVTLLNCDT
jgi:hypothetical protein